MRRLYGSLVLIFIIMAWSGSTVGDINKKYESTDNTKDIELSCDDGSTIFVTNSKYSSDQGENPNSDKLGPGYKDQWNRNQAGVNGLQNASIKPRVFWQNWEDYKTGFKIEVWYTCTKGPLPPTNIELSNYSVFENLPAGTIIGEIDISDPNGTNEQGDSHFIEIIGGDKHLFSFEGGEKSVLNPKTIDGLILWLDALNIDGNNNDSISDGVDVSTWIDLSGAGNNGTAQSTKGKFNAQKNGVLFNGGYYSLPRDIMANTSFTAIFVEERTQTGNYQYLLGQSGGIGRRCSSKNKALHYGYGNNDKFIMNFWCNDLNRSIRGMQDGVSNLTVGRYTKSGKSEFFFNGEYTTHGNRDYLRPNGVTWVGGARASNGRYKGYIKEVLIFNKVISDENVQLIQNYLKNKWKLKDVVVEPKYVTNGYKTAGVSIQKKQFEYNGSGAWGSGSDQVFTVPDSVKNINLKLWGAGGGGGISANGGHGGYIAGHLPVSSGDELKIVVGQGGIYTSTAQDSWGYGYGGRIAIGASSNSEPEPCTSSTPYVGQEQSGSGAGSGGGGTFVLKNDTVVAVAAGGGGGGKGNCFMEQRRGGNGGGFVGGAGSDTDDNTGDGGTQEGKGVIGNQEGGQHVGNYTDKILAGAGGGGWYGGGAAAADGMSGGGGSSYIGDLAEAEIFDAEKFSPKKIEGLILWLDAKNIDGKNNSTISNDDLISKWIDLSGSDNHSEAHNNHSNYMPKFKRAGFNNHETLEFRGDAMKVNDPNQFNIQEFTVFVVGVQDLSACSIWQCTLVTKYGENHKGWQMRKYDRHNSFAMTIRGTSANDDNRLDNVDDQENITIFRFSESDRYGSLWINGSRKFHQQQGGDSRIDYDSSYLGIGARYSGTSLSATLTGEISEVLFFKDSLSDEDREKVLYYLSQKWELQESVDSDGDGEKDSIDLENPKSGFTRGNTNSPPGTYENEDYIEGIGFGADQRRDGGHGLAILKYPEFTKLQLKTTQPFDYELQSNYKIRVAVQDRTGNRFEKDIVINVLNDLTEDGDGDGVLDQNDGFPDDPNLSVMPNFPDFSTVVVEHVDEDIGDIEGNLMLWLDASYPLADIGMPDNDTPIQTWVDLSGNQKHATQRDVSFAPTFLESAHNGKAGISFSNDYLDVNSILAGGSNGRTIFAVTIPNTDAQSDSSFLTINGDEEGTDLGGIYQISTESGVALNGINAGDFEIFSFLSPSSYESYVVDANKNRTNIGSTTSLRTSEIPIFALGSIARGNACGRRCHITHPFPWMSLGMAGKHFVFHPTQWNNQTIFFQPHYKNNGPTNIKIYKGRDPSSSSPNNEQTKNAGETGSWSNNMNNSNIEIIADQPIVVMFTGTSFRSHIAIPPAENIIYGTNSQTGKLGAVGNSSVDVDVYCTDGSTAVYKAGQGAASIANHGSHYSGKSCKYVARDNRKIGGFTVNDGDGEGGSAFLPKSKFSKEFPLPYEGEWVKIISDKPARCTLKGTNTNINLTGNDKFEIYHAKYSGSLSAGTVITCDEPVMLVSEPSSAPRLGSRHRFYQQETNIITKRSSGSGAMSVSFDKMGTGEMGIMAIRNPKDSTAAKIKVFKNGQELKAKRGANNKIEINIIGSKTRIGGGSKKRFNGTISELLVFDKPLTKIDILKLTDYLAKKWEITSADDYDGDGISNQEERSIGSSPFDDKDKPIRIGAGSSAQVVVPGSATLPDFSDTISESTGQDLSSVENDLVLWLDGSYPEADLGNPMDGDIISTWLDLSGNNNYAVQSSLENSPVYKESVHNGKAGIVFENDYLDIDKVITPGKRARTIFAVTKPDNNELEQSSFLTINGDEEGTNLGGIYQISTEAGVALNGINAGDFEIFSFLSPSYYESYVVDANKNRTNIGSTTSLRTSEIPIFALGSKGLPYECGNRCHITHPFPWMSLGMAGKHFVLHPTQWNNQTIFFQPHYKNNGPTNIKIYKGRDPSSSSPNNEQTKNAGETGSWSNNMNNSNIEIIADQPIVVMFTGTSFRSYIAIPPAENIIYGTNSQAGKLGAVGNSSVDVDVYCTDGSTAVYKAGQGAASIANHGSHYSGKSCKYVARDNRKIGGFTVNDGDGEGGSAFLPKSKFSKEFPLPYEGEWVKIISDKPARCTLKGTNTNIDLTGNDEFEIYHAKHSGSLSAGTVITCDEPVMLVSEPSSAPRLGGRHRFYQQETNIITKRSSGNGSMTLKFNEMSVDEMNVMTIKNPANSNKEGVRVYKNGHSLEPTETKKSGEIEVVGSLTRIGGGNKKRFKGAISEIMVFDKELTDLEILKITHYLTNKWGIIIDLDGDGFSNDSEIEFGTSPYDPADAPINLSQKTIRNPTLENKLITMFSVSGKEDAVFSLVSGNGDTHNHLFTIFKDKYLQSTETIDGMNNKSIRIKVDTGLDQYELSVVLTMVESEVAEPTESGEVGERYDPNFKFSKLNLMNEGLVAEYNAASWDADANVWRDSSGNGHDITNITGTPLFVSVDNFDIREDGLKGFDYINGSTSVKLDWPTSTTLATNWTIAHLARYAYSGHKRRIIQATSSNFVSGHWNGRAGVAHQHNGWIGSSGNYGSKTHDWIFNIQYNDNYYRKKRNDNWSKLSQDRSNISGFRLGVNLGNVSGETSNFNIAEVLIFNKTLTQDEIAILQTYFEDKYYRFKIANNPPVITSAPPKTEINEHSEFIYDIQSTDPENDYVDFTLLKPESATLISGSGVGFLQWTPGAEDIGDYDLIIEAKDSAGNTIQQVSQLTVLNIANDPPSKLALERTDLYSPIPAGGILTSILASDKDNNHNITFSLVSGDGDTDNSKFLIDGANLILNEAIDSDATLYIRVQASDGSLSSSKSFTLSFTYEDTDGDGVTDRIDLAPNDPNITAIRPDFTEVIDTALNMNTGLEGLKNNLLFWIDGANIDAQNNDTLVSDASVSKWYDLSGKANSATGQGSPIYKDDNSIYFSHQNNYFSIPNFTSGMGEGEMYAVVRVNSESDKNSGFHQWADNGSGDLHYSWNNQNIYFKFGRNYRHQFNPPEDLTKFHVYNASSSSSGIYTRINNDLKKSATNGSVRWGDSNKIGRSNSNRQWKGYIREILFFNKVTTDEERQKIHAYLGIKWGIPLDSDGDGYADLIEVSAGTSIFNPEEFPPIPDFTDTVEDVLKKDDVGLDAVEENIMFWIDASNIDNGNNVSISDGDVIKKWIDLSGNDYHGTGQGSPIYKDDNSIYFSHQNNYFSIPNFTSGMGEGEMYAVVRVNSESDANSGFHQWADNGSGDLHYSWNNQNIYFKFGRNYRHAFNPPEDLTKFHVYNASSSSSGIYTRINNDLKKSATNGSVRWGDSNKIGRSNSNRHWKGYIKEILFLKKLATNEEREAIHQYLAVKWMLEEFDTDGDGFSDGVEVVAGTSPNDPDDNPAPDFSDTVDALVGEALELDTAEGDLKLWLDATNINGANNAGINDDSGVVTWFDMSGSGNSGIKCGNNHGIYHDDLKGVFFQNTCYNIQTNLTTNTSFTIFAVEKRSGNGGNYFIGQDGANSTNQNIHYGYRNNATFKNDFYSNGVNFGIDGYDGNINLSVGRYAKGGSRDLFYNGKFIEGNTGAHLINSGVTWIGRAAGNNYYNGHMMEVLIFQRDLSDQEILGITKYLTKKWDLGSRVDSDGDGFSDEEELETGYDPYDYESNILPDFSDTLSHILEVPTEEDPAPKDLKLRVTLTDINTALVLMEVKIKGADGSFYTLSNASAQGQHPGAWGAPSEAIDGVIDQVDGHRYHGDSTSSYPGVYQSWQAEFSATQSNGVVELYYNKNYGGGPYIIEILDSDGTVIDSTTYDLDNGTVYSGSPGNAYYYTGEIDMSFEAGQGSVLDMLEDKLELWLDASNVNALNNEGLADNSTVELWMDLSRNGRDLLQSSVDSMPTLKENILNEKAVLYFDGGDFLETSKVPIAEGDDNYSYYAVWKSDEKRTSVIYEQNRSSEDAGRRSSLKTKSDGKYGLSGQIDSIGNPLNVGAPPRMPYQYSSSNDIDYWNMSGIILDEKGVRGESNAMYIIHNGKEYLTSSFPFNDANIGIYKAGVGRKIPKNNEKLIGSIAELLVFSEPLNHKEQLELQVYLNKKWGMSSIMDSDGDGFKDEDEIAGGYDPYDADSNLLPKLPKTVNDIIVDGTAITESIDLDSVAGSLALWLDASKILGVENDEALHNTQFSKWWDLSGNSSHAEATQRPKLVMDYYGTGQDIVDLNSAYLDLYMKTHVNQNVTMFFVYDRQGKSSWDSLFDAFTHSNYNTWWFMDNRDNNASQSAIHGSTWTYFNSGEIDKLNLVMVKVNADSGLAYLNGEQILNTHNISFKDSNTFRSDRIVRIGRQASNANKHNTDAHLAEILVFYEELSDEDTTRITYYLSKKWGIEGIDSDGDGFSDAKELEAGVSPIDPSENLLPKFSNTVNEILKIEESAAYGLMPLPTSLQDAYHIMLDIPSQAAESMESSALFGNRVRDLAFDSFGLTTGNQSGNQLWLKGNDLGDGFSATKWNELKLAFESEGFEDLRDESESMDFTHLDQSLSLWLDASKITGDENSDSLHNTSMSMWMDLSGLGSHAIAGQQPKLIMDKYGEGGDIVDLNNAYLDLYMTTHTNQNVTMFFVYDRQGKSSWDSLFDAWTHNNYNTWWFMDNRDNNASQSAIQGSTWTYFDSGEVDKLNLVMVKVNAGSGLAYLNGEQVLNTHNISFYDSNTFRSDRIVRIGRQASDANKHNTDAHLAEILVFYEELSDKDITNVNAYLSKKWSLEGIDSDGDGFLDTEEISAGTSIVDSEDFPVPDFSDTLNEQVSMDIDVSSIEENLVLWLDSANMNAKNNAGINDGDRVNKWFDLSGNGHAVMQSDANSQPILQSNQLLFDGANDYFTGGDILDVGLAEGWTIIVLGKVEQANSGFFLAKSFYSDQDNRYGISYNYEYLWDDGNNSNHALPSKPLNTEAILMMNIDRVSKVSKGFRDGLQIGNDKSITQDNTYDMNSISNFLVGAYNDVAGTGLYSGLFLDGTISEILIFNKSLTENEFAKVHYYLSTKWGLEATVDSDGDGFLDQNEIDSFSSPYDAKDIPTPDFTDAVQDVILGNDGAFFRNATSEVYALVKEKATSFYDFTLNTANDQIGNHNIEYSSDAVFVEDGVQLSSNNGLTYPSPLDWTGDTFSIVWDLTTWQGTPRIWNLWLNNNASDRIHFYVDGGKAINLIAQKSNDLVLKSVGPLEIQRIQFVLTKNSEGELLLYINGQKSFEITNQVINTGVSDVDYYDGGNYDFIKGNTINNMIVFKDYVLDQSEVTDLYTNSIKDLPEEKKCCYDPDFQFSKMGLINEGLVAEYNATSWDSDAKIWRDASGNGHDVISFPGTKKPSFVSSNDFNVLSDDMQGFDYIDGGTNARMRWPSSTSFSNNWTIAHLTRYDNNGISSTSGLKRRIFQADTKNFISGHWNNRAGVAHQNNSWIGSNNNFGDSVYDWIFSIQLNDIYYRKKRSSDWSKFSENRNDVNGMRLTVNTGQYSNENSDYNIAELLIFDKILSEDEVKIVQTYFVDKYEKLKTAKPPERVRDPIEDKMLLWLDGSNIDARNNETITAGDVVTVWYDMSGSKNHATLVSGGAIASSGNIVFDGDDGYALPNGTIPTGNNSYEIFYVGSPAEMNDGAFIASGISGGNNESNTFQYSDAGKIMSRWGSNDINSTENSVYLNEDSVSIFSYNKESGRKIVVNGKEVALDSGASRNGSELNNAIGFISDSNSNYLTGHIKEVIVFDSLLSDEERNELSTYLSQKWGMLGQIDSDGDGLTNDIDKDPYNDQILDIVISKSTVFTEPTDYVALGSPTLTIETNVDVGIESTVVFPDTTNRGSLTISSGEFRAPSIDGGNMIIEESQVFINKIGSDTTQTDGKIKPYSGNEIEISGVFNQVGGEIELMIVDNIEYDRINIVGENVTLNGKISVVFQDESTSPVPGYSFDLIDGVLNGDPVVEVPEIIEVLEWSLDGLYKNGDGKLRLMYTDHSIFNLGI